MGILNNLRTHTHTIILCRPVFICIYIYIWIYMCLYATKILAKKLWKQQTERFVSAFITEEEDD